MKAIEKLGGAVCPGLSFVNGPDCPVPKESITFQDLNISHRRSIGFAKREGCVETVVLKMKNPLKRFIILCSLCNQRMRYVAKEFKQQIKLPNRVIGLYTNGWSLEDIAMEYGCGYATISNFLKENGVEIRRNLGGINAWRNNRDKLLAERQTRNLTPKRIKLAKRIHKMYDDGDSIREIAQWIGLIKGNVQVLLTYAV